MLRREQVFVKHEEVRILADLNGALGAVNAKLFRAVDGVASSISSMLILSSRGGNTLSPSPMP